MTNPTRTEALEAALRELVNIRRDIERGIYVTGESQGRLDAAWQAARAALALPPDPEAAPSYWENEARRYAQNAEFWRAKAEAAPRQAPRPGSPEASAMIDSVLAEYGWPANPKNAARAGYEAACRLLAARPAPDAVHSQPQMAGLVWALAVRGEHGREAHLMFDTEDQAHAFVEWCKTQIEPPPEREAQQAGEQR